jgi:hypothetical protein
VAHPATLPVTEYLASVEGASLVYAIIPTSMWMLVNVSSWYLSLSNEHALNLTMTLFVDVMLRNDLVVST